MSTDVRGDTEAERLRMLAERDGLKSLAHRNRLGQFATPTALANDILSVALGLLEAREVRFLEPGFGTGPFFSALRRLAPPNRIARAAGFELDPHYGEPAKAFWRGTGLQLRLSDFTATAPPKTEAARYNLIVCNPPYVRHHHLAKEQKQRLKASASDHLGFELNGLGGLYTYFMVLSQRWMCQGGVGAWLIPSEFMDVNYGRQLKRFLSECVSLLRVHRFDPHEVQFGDALVSSAVVIFQNAPPPADHSTQFSFGGTVARPAASERLKVGDFRAVPKWTALPRLSHAPSSAAGASEMRLGDLFRIKRGIATGCNEFFVMRPDVARERGIPRRFLQPILPSPRYIQQAIIERDETGNARIENPQLLLNCDLQPQTIEASYPRLWAYLREGVRQGIHERYLCRHRAPWYLQEVRPPAPILCTYMGRQTTQRNGAAFRFILNRSEATVANVYLMLYPKPPLAALLAKNDAILKQIWSSLNSIAPEILLGEGRVYGGGLHKLEPKELANVPARLVLPELPPSLRLCGSKKRG